MKTVERHKKTDFGDVWYVNAADGTYRFAVYKYDDDDDTIYLSNVFVKEDSRRQGYGNEILTAAEDYANRLGASVICLKVLSGSDVHRWYKRHGYEDLEKDEEERGYMWMKKELKRVNESIWADMHRRSTGEQVKKEDEMTQKDLDDLDKYIMHFASEVVYGQGMGEEAATLDNFCDHIRQDYDVKDSDKDKIIEYVKKVWFDELCDDVTGAIEQAQKEYNQDMYESVWSDIHRRSNGTQERKEDDVNILDLDEFYEYVKKHYKNKVEYIDLDAMGGGNGDVLGVDITENIILFYKPKRGHILLSWSKVKIPMPFFDEFADRFKIENPNAMRRIITEKDGSCTNKTFIDVIDFFLDYKESLINESIWADIHKRSNGDVVRKEDDVNLLDKDGLYEYLISHYKPVEGIDIKSYIFCGNSYINLCVFTYPTDTRYSILLDILNCRVKVRTPYIKRWPANLLDMIYKKYNREDIIDKNRDHMTFITPKEGKGNNQFYIDFLDMILNNVDKPLLKKVINESIWADIHKRSNGEAIRKEDDNLSDEDCDFLDDCLMEFASRVVWDGEKASREKLSNCIRKQSNTYKDIDVEKVIKYVEEHWSEISEELDDLIAQEEKEKRNGMYESVWKDIHQRSTGEQVRKEDELLNDKENQILKQTAKMFKNAVRVSKYNDDEEGYDYSDTKEDFIYYIEQRKGEMFWTGVKEDVYDKIIDYVNKKWTDGCKGIDEFISEYIYECDGVPGGITPADVGGMGAITFPGADGTPGSGDIPMPTGHVYQQVAPFGIFIRAKKGKKRKKKFRKEDEPCVHSENPPIYSHVDDFRDYVDRVYNQIDRKK